MIKDDAIEILLIGLVTLVVVAGLLLGIYALSSPPTCDAMTQSIGFPHKWEFWSGCLIEVESDRWIPLENFRYFDE